MASTATDYIQTIALIIGIGIPLLLHYRNLTNNKLSEKRKIFYELLNNKVTIYHQANDIKRLTDAINSILIVFPNNNDIEYAVQRYMRCVNTSLPAMHIDIFQSNEHIPTRASIAERIDITELENSIINILYLISNECKLHYTSDKIRCYMSYKPNVLITENEVNQLLKEQVQCTTELVNLIKSNTQNKPKLHPDKI